MRNNILIMAQNENDKRYDLLAYNAILTGSWTEFVC